MKVLVCCDKFKGSLTAVEACEAVAAGFPNRWEVELCPIADGGEGFVEAMLAAGGGRRLVAECRDALGRSVEAEFGMMGEVAVIEMSAASGLWRIAPGERDVRRSSTFGTGELMRRAVEELGAREILVGLGGSATNDGGAGMAAALGVRFLDVAGRELEPHPAGLAALETIDARGRIALPKVRVASDVDHPLLGGRGASAVFGPQKGAGPEDVEFLEGVLARVVEKGGLEEVARRPGAGAAGGLGFGLMAWAGAELESGFNIVARALDLQRRMAEVDLVVTGEGSLDAQTLGGKGPAGVVAMARAAGVRAMGVGGRVTPEAAAIFDEVVSLERTGLALGELMARAAELVTAGVREAAGRLRV